MWSYLVKENRRKIVQQHTPEADVLRQQKADDIGAAHPGKNTRSTALVDVEQLYPRLFL